VLQSAIANTYRDFDLYVEGTNFRAWIFRYVNGEIRNANRRAAKAPGSLGDQADQFFSGGDSTPNLSSERLEALREDPDAVLDHCDEVLAEAIRALPERERSVVLLRAIGDFKYREMAEILEIPLGTVMTSLSRARQRLRERLAAFGAERGLID